MMAGTHNGLIEHSAHDGDKPAWLLQPRADGKKYRIRVRLKTPESDALKTFSTVKVGKGAYSKEDFEPANLVADQRLAAKRWEEACGGRTHRAAHTVHPGICQKIAAKQALLLVTETARISDGLAAQGWTRFSLTFVSSSWAQEQYSSDIHRSLRRDVQRWLRNLQYPAVFMGAIDICKNRFAKPDGTSSIIWQPHCHGEIVAMVSGDDPEAALRSDLHDVIKASGRGESVHKPVVCKRIYDPEGWRLYFATSLMLRGVTQRSSWKPADGRAQVRTERIGAKDQRRILLEWSRDTPQSRFVLVGARKQGSRFVPTDPRLGTEFAVTK